MIGARLLAFDVAPVRRQTTDMENQKLLRLVLGKAPLPSDDVCANHLPFFCSYSRLITQTRMHAFSLNLSWSLFLTGVVLTAFH